MDFVVLNFSSCFQFEIMNLHQTQLDVISKDYIIKSERGGVVIV